MGSSLSSPSSPSSLLPPSGSDQALPNKVNCPIRQQEPTEPSTKLCMICMDEKSPSDIFRGTTSCTHSYCTECTVRYVTTKVDENAARIKCPDVACTQLMEPNTCLDVIPKDLFERWDKALFESLIMSWEKVYCPFENCSAVIVVVDDDDARVTQTECPSCHRLFCAQCKVPWHASSGCKKTKNSDKEDALLIGLAKEKQWMRCSKCKFYVDKASGCLHIICRCGFQFCYRCGSSWDSLHSCKIART